MSVFTYAFHDPNTGKFNYEKVDKLISITHNEKINNEWIFVGNTIDNDDFDNDPDDFVLVSNTVKETKNSDENNQMIELPTLKVKS